MKNKTDTSVKTQRCALKVRTKGKYEERKRMQMKCQETKSKAKRKAKSTEGSCANNVWREGMGRNVETEAERKRRDVMKEQK